MSTTFNLFFFLMFIFFLVLFEVCSLNFLYLNYSFSSKIVKHDTPKTISTKHLKNLNHTILFKSWLLITLKFFFFFFFFKNHDFFFFFNNLSFTNFSIKFLFLFSFFSFFFTKVVYTGLKSSVVNSLNLDFLISFIFILFSSPFIFLSNNLFIFFFFLELSSILVLFNLLSAKDTFNNLKVKYSISLKSKVIKEFFNSFFFQFWASFFSSVLIVYASLNFYYFFGTTEWFYLNFLVSFIFKSFTFYKNYFFFFNGLILFLSLIIKLGVSPIFFYKLEVYKGLPFFYVFFYSIFYFVYFVSILFVFSLYFLPVLFNALSFYFIFFVFFSTIFLLYYLPETSSFKNFFAISSAINTVFFLFLFIAVKL